MDVTAESVPGQPPAPSGLSPLCAQLLTPPKCRLPSFHRKMRPFAHCHSLFTLQAYARDTSMDLDLNFKFDIL